MQVFLFLADGFECIEAMAPVDVFRRAGINITTVSLTSSVTVTSSNGVEMKADATLGSVDILGGDALILPGGYPGYENLKKNDAVGRAVSLYYETGRVVGAICAAPIVLQHYGIGYGRKITCHRCIKDDMKDYVYTGKPVEKDGMLITAIGAGHALDFGLSLLETLCGHDVVTKIKPGMEL